MTCHGLLLRAFKTESAHSIAGSFERVGLTVDAAIKTEMKDVRSTLEAILVKTDTVTVHTM